MIPTVKLIITLLIVCIIALIISFFIWDFHLGRHLAQSETTAISPKLITSALPYKLEKKNADTGRPLLRSALSSILFPSTAKGKISLKYSEEAKEAISKIYIKFDGELPAQPSTLPGQENPTSPSFDDSSAIDIDAQGAFGYRLSSGIHKFQATPLIGYTFNLQTLKISPQVSMLGSLQRLHQEPSAVLPSILHWRGPFLGFNTELKCTRRLNIDAGYSFHWVSFTKITFQNVPQNENTAFSMIFPIQSPSQTGIGHTGHLGMSFKIGNRLHLGAFCRYKQFNTLIASDNDAFSRPSSFFFNEQQIIRSFQSTGEINFQF